MRNDFTFLNAQNSHRNIKEAQFQMSIKPGSWMLFRREEETQRHNLIPMAIDEVGFKARKPPTYYEKNHNVKERGAKSKETYLKLEMATGCCLGEKKRLSDTQCDTNGLWRSRI
ncbi:uncharacterized protein LOC136034025 isoform X1 [Artemia franciscana]|uniref:uncharacterized protein LOC136034025 isoform X1 n=1 Tax=Artemia franciscana TaxID=6661 RepID=UPI0032DAC0FB